MSGEIDVSKKVDLTQLTNNHLAGYGSFDFPIKQTKNICNSILFISIEGRAISWHKDYSGSAFVRESCYAGRNISHIKKMSQKNEITLFGLSHTCA